MPDHHRGHCRTHFAAWQLRHASVESECVMIMECEQCANALLVHHVEKLLVARCLRGLIDRAKKYRGQVLWTFSYSYF